MKIIRFILYIFLCLNFIIACAKDETKETVSPSPVLEAPTIQDPVSKSKESAVLEGDNIILATVNSTPITQYDVDLTIQTTLGKTVSSKLDAEGQKKVLESLVQSRAISQVQEKELTPKEKFALEKKVDAYREQLLVKQYLAKHTDIEPVTHEMVKEYYDKHPERFGAKNIRTYEMITSKQSVNSSERDNLITALKSPDKKTEWKTWVKELQGRGYPLQYKQGQTTNKLLHPKLQTLMQGLKKEESSALSFVQERAYIVRILDEKQVPPRPLNDVSAQIRKTLTPVQLKKAVKQASEQVLKDVNVVYRDEARNSK